jgi:hypothetical protein
MATGEWAGQSLVSGEWKFDVLHAINGVDSYGAMAVSHGRFGGFLLHRSASLRRISTGFTLGLSGPRSMFQDAENL